MTAHDAEWRGGLPEEEDEIRSGTLTDDVYADIGAPDGPIMVEFAVSDRCWVYRGPVAPGDDAASVLVAESRLMRCEMTAQQRRIWVRRQRSRTTLWSARIWLRYARFVAPPLPHWSSGHITGADETFRVWFSVR